MEMTKLEFKLNKIDTDIRIKMQEEIREKKVHSAKGINVKKDLKDKNENNYTHLKTNDLEEKKYITIDVEKDFKEKLSIQVEKVENIDGENSKGRGLDVKK